MFKLGALKTKWGGWKCWGWVKGALHVGGCHTVSSYLIQSPKDPSEMARKFWAHCQGETWAKTRNHSRDSPHFFQIHLSFPSTRSFPSPWKYAAIYPYQKSFLLTFISFLLSHCYVPLCNKTLKKNCLSCCQKSLSSCSPWEPFPLGVCLYHSIEWKLPITSIFLNLRVCSQLPSHLTHQLHWTQLITPSPLTAVILLAFRIPCFLLSHLFMYIYL